MSFLLKRDYFAFARPEQIEVETMGDDNKLVEREADAIEEISSYLNARYDLSKAFPNVNFWAYTKQLVKGDVLFLQKSMDYTPGQAIVVVGNDLPVIEIAGKCYRVGQSVPLNTVLPNNTYTGLVGDANTFYYSNHTGVVPPLSNRIVEDEGWTKGDNRISMLKRCVADLILYHLCSAINPRAIPEYRIQRRDDVIKWLRDVSNAKNNVNADFLTLKTFGDRKSNNISWGSNEKRVTHKY